MKLVILVVAFYGVVKGGYNSDGYRSNYGGLRSIAQGSANDAHSAVAYQHAAAQLASYVAKNNFALQASQAASTAQAALEGKGVLLQNLERQRVEAHRKLEGETKQLQSAKHAAIDGANTAQQARRHVRVLTEASSSAKSLARQADNAAIRAGSEQSSQNAMVAQAKSRLVEVEHNLEAVRADYQATKQSARNAAEYARKAQQNAEAASAQSTASSSIDGYEGYLGYGS